MQDQESTTSNNSKSKNFFLRIALPIIILNIIIWGGIVLFLLLRGSTTTSGRSTPDVKTEAVICRKSDAQYPYANFSSISRTETKVEMTFSDDILSNMYFSRDLFFSNSSDIEVAHQAITNSFGLDLNHAGYDAFAFSRNITAFSDHLNLSLKAAKDDLDSTSAPFFMLKLNESDFASLTKGKLTQSYQQQDFNCE